MPRSRRQPLGLIPRPFSLWCLDCASSSARTTRPLYRRARLLSVAALLTQRGWGESASHRFQHTRECRAVGPRISFLRRLHRKHEPSSSDSMPPCFWRDLAVNYEQRTRTAACTLPVAWLVGGVTTGAHWSISGAVSVGLAPYGVHSCVCPLKNVESFTSVSTSLGTCCYHCRRSIVHARFSGRGTVLGVL